MNGFKNICKDRMKRTGRTNLCRLCSRRRLSAAQTLFFFLLTYLPALLLPACGKQVPDPPSVCVKMTVRIPPSAAGGTLDLFFFNKDPLRTLDSYERFESLPEGSFEAASRSGDKIVAGILNLPCDMWAWSDIRTFQRLSERVSDLTADRPDRPVMTGLAEVRAGRERRGELVLEPLLSRIVLHSLCCDFHSRPYRDAVLQDVDIYLVNVNRSFALFDDGTHTLPASWINMGERDDPASDAVHLARVEGTALPEAEFWCYPNAAAEEGLGRPLTCLVVEGTLLGERYWYPVGIPSIGRGETVSVDLTITRTGTSGPDIPVSTEAVRCAMQVLPWREMDAYPVLF